MCANSPGLKLLYSANGAIQEITGIEDWKPYYLEGDTKRFLEPGGRWFLEGEPKELIEHAYLPHFFGLYRHAVPYEKRNTEIYYTLRLDDEEVLPIEGSPYSGNSYLSWNLEDLNDFIIILAWVGETFEHVELNFLRNAGVKEFNFDAVGNVKLTNPDPTGHPFILFVKPETLAVIEPQRDSENIKAKLNWLMKAGQEEEFLTLWNSLADKPVFYDVEPNPLLSASLYHREELFWKVPELERYSQLRPGSNNPNSHISAMRGNVEFLKSLKNPREFDQQGKDGSFPVHQAIISGHEDYAIWLMENLLQKELKIADTETTPLREAIRYRRQKVFDYLMSNDASPPHFEDEKWGYHFYWAVRNGYSEIARYLLDHGADVSYKDGGNTVIDAALRSNSLEVAKLVFSQYKKLPYKFAPTKNTYLHRAAGLGAADMISLLVEKGIPLDAKTTNGGTPLHSAILAKDGHDAALRLLELGANPNITTKNSVPLIVLAFRLKDWAVFDALLKAGAHYEDREFQTKVIEHGLRHNVPEILGNLKLWDISSDFELYDGITVSYAADYFENTVALTHLGTAPDSIEEIAKPQLEAPSNLDEPLKFISREGKPPPERFAKKYGAVKTKVTAIFTKKGQLILPKFNPGLSEPMSAYFRDMLVTWKIKPPMVGGNRVNLKVSFPLEFPYTAKTETLFIKDVSKGRVVAPEAIVRIAPIFPVKLRKSGEDKVQLEFTVNEKGNVMDILVMVPAKQEELTDNAIAALKQWKFKPGLMNDIPTKTKMMTPFTFRTNGNIEWNPKPVPE